MYRSRKDRKHRKIISDYHSSKFNYRLSSRGGDGFGHLPKRFREDAEYNHSKWWSTYGNMKKIFSRYGQEGRDDWFQRSRLRSRAKREPLQPYYGAYQMNNYNDKDFFDYRDIDYLLEGDGWEFYDQYNNWKSWIDSDQYNFGLEGCQTNNHPVLTKEHKEEYIEIMFGGLLEREVSIADNIQPLSISLISRIEDLKKAGDAAKAAR